MSKVCITISITFLVTLVMGTALAYAAEVYKCTVGDKIVYQQTPCNTENDQTSLNSASIEEVAHTDITLMTSEGDFRGFSWGESISAVREKESYELIHEIENGLLYKGSISNVRVLIHYEFIDGKLSSGMYLNIEQHTNKNDYISDYNRLKELLSMKYGMPSTDHIAWKNELFRDKPKSWGKAVSVGHLVYLAQWYTNTTEINHSLMHTTGFNQVLKDGIGHMIKYYNRSKSTEDDQEELKQKKALDQL